MKRPLIVAGLFFLLALTVLSFFAALFYLNLFLPANRLPAESVTEFIIEPGTPFVSIQRRLAGNNLIEKPNNFYYAAKILGKVSKLQAGKYHLPGSISYVSLVRRLSNAPRYYVKVTIPEGMEMWEIAEIFHQKLQIPVEEFIAYQNDPKRAGVNDPSVVRLEGYLFPDTYFFYEGVSAEEVIRRLVKQFYTVYDDKMKAKADSLRLTLNDVVTLASIVEGEVIVKDEAPLVASVYWNRLNKRMKLQADPTIQYIVEGPDIRLRERHLSIDSPYNTYKYYGFPPGPINNPGRKSLEAVLWPDSTAYLYFVAKGDGTHIFSKTLAQHNRAKEQFQKVRWEVLREKRRAAREAAQKDNSK